MMNHISTRRLVAVDLENLAATGLVDVDWAIDFAYLLSTTLDLKEYDLTFVAGGTRNWEAVTRVAEILHGQPRIRKGADGADLTLLDALEQMPVTAIESERTPITEVVIMSGDGIFTRAARRFRDQGLTVVGVSRRRSMNRALAAACTQVVYLDEPTTDETALALAA
jgi:hypothetical protein